MRQPLFKYLATTDPSELIDQTDSRAPDARWINDAESQIPP